jgi:hypothetical protein
MGASYRSRTQETSADDRVVKRRILETGNLNCTLDGAKLVRTLRKPLEAFAEGLVSERGRDDRI